ncbi:hypothetical protein GTP23_12650 [Pseudoduganella sp. FT93W]|uniref:AIPR protein n=1 Tax=Duganella fentianensis TaxID=2692177 RepID=A0A845I1E2_9BURK|nr:AIPR family protein [Duganella fentianensis]MYN45897.1 hypothetical protein [Duganella fentianensis]
MDLSEVLRHLNRDMRDVLRTGAEQSNSAMLFGEDAFIVTVAGYMARAGQTFSPQLCQYSAIIGGDAVRLSGFSLSDEGDRLDLLVSLYHAAEAPLQIASGEIDQAVAQCVAFLGHALDGSLTACVDESHDAFGLIGTVGMAYDSIERVSISVLTDGLSGDFEVPSLQVRNKSVVVRVIDLAVLAELIFVPAEEGADKAIAHFRQDLVASLLDDVQRGRDTAAACFADEAGARLGDAEEITDFQRCMFKSLSGDAPMQVDGFATDDVDGTFTLLITDFSAEGGMPVISQEELRRAFDMLYRYAGLALSGGLPAPSSGSIEPGIGLAAELLRMRDTITRLKLYLVSNRVAEATQETEARGPLCGIPVETHVWDIRRMYGAFVSESGRDDFEVSFLDADGTGMPALSAGTSGGNYEGYLCTISGEVLADIYERNGSRLLEGNVRSFLSTKGKINSGIQLTLSERPEMFFAYNNGIAATAEAVTTDTTDGLRILQAKNFQIVNGGQTTASLAAASRLGTDLSGVRVQMKLSVLPPGRAMELIPLIARFANSQNKVNESDFFANHPYHHRLEQISRRLTAPASAGHDGPSYWYYERSRGQYVNDQKDLSGQEKERFLMLNPKAQLLTKLDVAKLENTWNGYPHKVSTGAQKNFVFFAGLISKRWNSDDAQFDDGYYRNIVAMAILFRHTEKLVKEQSWYNGAYRPNIVTYSLALLQYMVKHQGGGREIDLAKIWEAQSVRAEITAQLVVLTRLVLDVLTDVLRTKTNVTEWAKAEACWERAMCSAPRILPEFLDLLVDPLARQYLERQGGGMLQTGYGVFARTSVLGISPAKWKSMLDWGISRNLLDMKAQTSLRQACRMPNFLPSVKECERILDIRARLIRSGYSE